MPTSISRRTNLVGRSELWFKTMHLGTTPLDLAMAHCGARWMPQSLDAQIDQSPDAHIDHPPMTPMSPPPVLHLYRPSVSLYDSLHLLHLWQLEAPSVPHLLHLQLEQVEHANSHLKRVSSWHISVRRDLRCGGSTMYAQRGSDMLWQVGDEQIWVIGNEGVASSSIRMTQTCFQ